MNVFRRMKDIVTSSVNAALDKMEDPEKMIDLSIRELEDAISEMKGSLAEKSTELDRLAKDSAELEEKMKRWAERASLAVSKGMDDMAKEAISERMKAEDGIRLLEENKAMLENIIRNTEKNVEEASVKLSELKATSGTLKARAKLAKDRMAVDKKKEQTENGDWERRIDELKAKVERWEAEADIRSSFTKTETAMSFEELEEEDALDKELEALKRAQCGMKRIEEK